MKLTDFENPISGKKGNLLDLSTLWANIMGVFVLFLVFATGQNIANRVSGRFRYIDAQPDPIVRPAVTGPVYNDYY